MHTQVYDCCSMNTVQRACAGGKSKRSASTPTPSRGEADGRELLFGRSLQAKGQFQSSRRRQIAKGSHQPRMQHASCIRFVDPRYAPELCTEDLIGPASGYLFGRFSISVSAFAVIRRSHHCRQKRTTSKSRKITFRGGGTAAPSLVREREFFIDNQLVRIRLVTEMI